MPTCKNCGRTWDFEYSNDLCGAFCDGVWSQKLKVNKRDVEIDEQQSEIANLKSKIAKLQAELATYSSCRTADGQPYGPGSKVYYRDPTGYVQSLDVGVSFKTDSSSPEPVYHPYPVYSSREAADE